MSTTKQNLETKLASLGKRIDVINNEERQLAQVAANHIAKLKTEAKQAGLWETLRKELATETRTHGVCTTPTKPTNTAFVGAVGSTGMANASIAPARSCQVEADHPAVALHSMLEGDSEALVPDEPSEEAKLSSPRKAQKLVEISELTKLAQEAVAAVAKIQLHKQKLQREYTDLHATIDSTK